MLKLAFIFVSFVIANAEIDENNESNPDTRIKFVRDTFGRLLKSIVKINEERFDTMKKLGRLQDYNVAMDVLRNGDRGGNHGSVLAIVIVDEEQNNKHEAKRQSTNHESTDSSETDSSFQENIPKGKHWKNSLRVLKSYQKKAAKVCRKACQDAYKTTCSEYACSKKMMKTFKKECKIACENRFH